MIAVKQPDGTILSTTIKAKFGYLKILNAKEKKVLVNVNGNISNLQLRLSESGDVYFPEEIKKYINKNEKKVERKGSDLSTDGGYLSSADNPSAFSQPQSPKQLKNFSDTTPVKSSVAESINSIEDSVVNCKDVKETNLTELNQQEINDALNLKMNLGTVNLKRDSIPKTPNAHVKGKKLDFTLRKNSEISDNTSEFNLDCVESKKSFHEEYTHLIKSNDIDNNKINEDYDKIKLEEKKIEIKEVTNLGRTGPSGINVPNVPSINTNFTDLNDMLSSHPNLENSNNYDTLHWNLKYSSSTKHKNSIEKTFSFADIHNIDGIVRSNDNQDELKQERSNSNNNFRSRTNITNYSIHSTSVNTTNNNFSISSSNQFTIEPANPKLKLEFSNCWYSAHKTKNIEEEFYKNFISAEDFNKDPWTVINSKNLAIKFEDSLYNWKAIAPIIMSYIVYGKSLPQDVIDKLTETEKSIFSIFSFSKAKNTNVLKLDANKIPSPRKFSTEFGNNRNFNITTISDNSNINTSAEDTIKKDNEKQVEEVSKEKDFKLYYKKVFQLTSDQIKSLGLKDGKNEVSFVVHSRLQGEQKLTCNCYLWNYDAKVIISDVDGTITRSDFLGHVLPLFGKDWTHKGIVEFFNNIYSNGYKILYLSARALCQSESTKKYLTTLTQENLHLPEGPIMLSPDGLMTSFKREVIDRTPQKFKIACLNEILSLFPDDENPFYSGFGNRVTVSNINN